MAEPTSEMLEAWRKAHDGKLPSEHLGPLIERRERRGAVPPVFFGTKITPAGLMLKGDDGRGNDFINVAVNPSRSTLAVSPVKDGVLLGLKDKDGAYGTQTVNVANPNADPNKGHVFLDLSGHKKGTRVEISGEFKKHTILVLRGNPSNEINVPAQYDVVIKPDVKGASVNVLSGLTADNTKQTNDIIIHMPIGTEDKIFVNSKDIEMAGGSESGVNYLLGPDARGPKKELNIAMTEGKSPLGGNQVKLVLYDPAVPGVERTITLQNGIPLDKDHKPIIKPDEIKANPNVQDSVRPSNDQRDEIKTFMIAELDAFRQEVKKKQPATPDKKTNSAKPVEANLAMAHSSNPLPRIPGGVNSR